MASAAASGAAMSLETAREDLLAALPADPAKEALRLLKEEQLALREQKKELSRKVRNAQRKAQRLRKKARQLSDTDLLEVLMARKQSKVDKRERAHGALRPALEGGAPEAAADGAASSSPTATESRSEAARSSGEDMRDD